MKKTDKMPTHMEVFISWSGERSRVAAEALREWLPKIINAIEPWLSSTDIEKGSRWSSEISGRLEKAKAGIICLTPGNLHSDWILFEAGALSKTVTNTHVCTFLIDLQQSQVSWPLAQFQHTAATKDDIYELLKTLNAKGDKQLSDTHLHEAFEVWWPKLDEKLKSLPLESGPAPPKVSTDEMLQEILGFVRDFTRPKPPSSESVFFPQLSVSEDIGEVKPGDWRTLLPDRDLPTPGSAIDNIFGILRKLDATVGEISVHIGPEGYSVNAKGAERTYEIPIPFAAITDPIALFKLMRRYVAAHIAVTRGKRSNSDA